MSTPKITRFFPPSLAVKASTASTVEEASLCQHNNVEIISSVLHEYSTVQRLSSGDLMDVTAGPAHPEQVPAAPSEPISKPDVAASESPTPAPISNQQPCAARGDEGKAGEEAGPRTGIGAGGTAPSHSERRIHPVSNGCAGLCSALDDLSPVSASGQAAHPMTPGAALHGRLEEAAQMLSSSYVSWGTTTVYPTSGQAAGVGSSVSGMKRLKQEINSQLTAAADDDDRPGPAAKVPRHLPLDAPEQLELPEQAEAALPGRSFLNPTARLAGNAAAKDTEAPLADSPARQPAEDAASPQLPSSDSLVTKVDAEQLPPAPAPSPPAMVSTEALVSGGIQHPYWQSLQDWLAAAYRPHPRDSNLAFEALRSADLQLYVRMLPMELMTGIVKTLSGQRQCPLMRAAAADAIHAVTSCLVNASEMELQQQAPQRPQAQQGGDSEPSSGCAWMTCPRPTSLPGLLRLPGLTETLLAAAGLQARAPPADTDVTAATGAAECIQKASALSLFKLLRAAVKLCKESMPSRTPEVADEGPDQSSIPRAGSKRRSDLNGDSNTGSKTKRRRPAAASHDEEGFGEEAAVPEADAGDLPLLPADAQPGTQMLMAAAGCFLGRVTISTAWRGAARALAALRQGSQPRTGIQLQVLLRCLSIVLRERQLIAAANQRQTGRLVAAACEAAGAAPAPARTSGVPSAPCPALTAELAVPAAVVPTTTPAPSAEVAVLDAIVPTAKAARALLKQLAGAVLEKASNKAIVLQSMRALAALLHDPTTRAWLLPSKPPTSFFSEEARMPLLLMRAVTTVLEDVPSLSKSPLLAVLSCGLATHLARMVVEQRSSVAGTAGNKNKRCSHLAALTLALQDLRAGAPALAEGAERCLALLQET